MHGCCERCGKKTHTSGCWCGDCHKAIMDEIQEREQLPCGGQMLELCRSLQPVDFEPMEHTVVFELASALRQFINAVIPGSIPGGSAEPPWDEDSLGSWGAVVRAYEDDLVW